jgi:hypothetical protein
MIDKSRRKFFNNFVENSVQLLARACGSLQNELGDAFQDDADDTDYFKSYESAYTLISENLPFLDEEIERLQIDIEGKSQLEIVKEIYEKSHVV